MHKEILYMYNSNNITYILTMLEAIEKITFYSQEFKDEEEFYFSNKQLNFNAVVNLLIAIGEENKKINNELKISNLVNWKSISAMRDKISHNYRGIDESMVWDIIHNHLQNLKIALIDMLPKIENHKLYIEEALKTYYYEDLGYLSNDK